jgi:hypothetical protein
LQDVQELPEYKDKVSLELEINTKRRGPRETGFISGQLICKDVTMMTVARDAVEAILRGKQLPILYDYCRTSSRQPENQCCGSMTFW